MLIQWGPLKEDVLTDLYTNIELTQMEICGLFDCDVRTIRKKLEELGIKRTLSEATTLAWEHGTMKYNPESIRRGIESSNWKGGKIYDSKGYVMIHAPNHPLSEKSGYIPEHRLMWFDVYPNTPINWVIHHLNGIKNDNRIENLLALSRKKHETWTIVKAQQKRIRELEKILEVN